MFVTTRRCYAQPLRAARAQAGGAPERVDVLGVLRALERAGVQYVLIGELAEVMHGSPLLPVTGTVTIVPRPGQRERISSAAAAAGGQPMSSSTTPAIEAPASFALEAYGTELVVHPAPPGTQGYDDLRRDNSSQACRLSAAPAITSQTSIVAARPGGLRCGRAPTSSRDRHSGHGATGFSFSRRRGSARPTRYVGVDRVPGRRRSGTDPRAIGRA
jgi:hypothetical protein